MTKEFDVRLIINNKINGWFILDKKVGITSRTAVTKISNLLSIKKVGHAGTLDPLASGILPIAIGEATKTISFVQDNIKIYSFIIKWGESTETDDSEGVILETSEIRPSKKEINKIIPDFVGKVLQKPPLYSAIKINGKRSYDLARKKNDVSHQPRFINIYKFYLKELIDIDKAEFIVECEKGTYVRSIARDLAEKLNTKGHIINLRRLAVGKFTEKDAIFVDFSKEIIHSPSILNNILPIITALDDIPALVLNEDEARRIKQGQKLIFNSIEKIDKFIKKYPNYYEFEKIYVLEDLKPIALVKIFDDLVKPVRIINF